MQKIALLLAGGKGERIGGNKPWKIFCGKPLLYWAIKPYFELELPLWISVRNLKQREEISSLLNTLFKPSLNPNFIIDEPPYAGLGPLSGIYAAMRRTFLPTLFIVSAVDQPFITPQAIKHLLNLGEFFLNLGVIFKRDQDFEPFPGIYPSSLSLELKCFLDRSSSKSLKGFLKALYEKNLLVQSTFWRIIDPKGLLFSNINTLKELKEAEECFSQAKT